MNDKNQSIAVSNLVNSTLIAELIPKLADLGILSEQDTYDIYDRALESIERIQAEAAAPDFEDICAEARRLIEEPLRATPRRSIDRS